MTLTPELIQVFGGRIARLRFYTFLGGDDEIRTRD